MRTSFVIAAGFTLSACAYQTVQMLPGHGGPAALTSGDIPCVMVAADGAYGSRVYAGSGRTVSTQIVSVVRRTWPEATLVEPPDENEAATRCGALGSNYLIVPTLLHWEDRATNWSGVRDHIDVEVHLLRIAPKELLRSMTFEARNNWFTLVDAAPSELLDDRFDAGVAQLLSMSRENSR